MRGVSCKLCHEHQKIGMMRIVQDQSCIDVLGFLSHRFSFGMSFVASVDALSDDEPARKTPPKALSEEKKPKRNNTKGSAGKGSAKVKPVKPAPKPKAGAKALKRPADASSSPNKGESLKRPAAAGKVAKDAAVAVDRVSVCKSLYKRNGVWSLKLNQKEVIRVTC